MLEYSKVNFYLFKVIDDYNTTSGVRKFQLGRFLMLIFARFTTLILSIFYSNKFVSFPIFLFYFNKPKSSLGSVIHKSDQRDILLCLSLIYLFPPY